MSAQLQTKKIPSYAIKVKSPIHWTQHIKPLIESSGVKVPYLKKGTEYSNLYVGVFNSMFFQGSAKFVESRKIPVLEDKSNYQPQKVKSAMLIERDFKGFPLAKALGYTLVELITKVTTIKYPEQVKKKNGHKKILAQVEAVLALKPKTK